MNENRRIDEVDCHILQELQRNARVSSAEMARNLGMAASAVGERVRKLEKGGLIKAYEARLDRKRLGRALTAFTFVHTEEAVGVLDTGERLAAIEGVMEVHYCAGRDSYLMKVSAPDTEALAVLIKEVGRIETVKDTQTTVVLSTIKETSATPVCDGKGDDA